MNYIFLFVLVLLQNASFVLVSRARNSNSIWYHAGASVFSNGLWILVMRKFIMNLDNDLILATYLVASVTGSLLMHHIAIKYIEKKKS
jgi:hypothetical protein